MSDTQTYLAEHLEGDLTCMITEALDGISVGLGRKYDPFINMDYAYLEDLGWTTAHESLVEKADTELRRLSIVPRDISRLESITIAASVGTLDGRRLLTANCTIKWKRPQVGPGEADSRFSLATRVKRGGLW